MKLLLLFFVGMALFVNTGCGKNKYELIKKEVITLPVAKDVELRSAWIQFFKGNNTQYFIYENNLKSLIIYNYDLKKEVFRVDIPGGVPAVDVINIDSIFYIPWGTAEIIMVGKNNQARLWSDLHEVSSDSVLFECYSMCIGAEPNGLSCWVELSHNIGSIQEYYKYPKMMKVNFNDKEDIVGNKMVYHPDKFLGDANYYSYIMSSVVCPNRNIIVSFEKDHYVYLYDNDGNLLSDEEVKSNKINSFSSTSFADTKSSVNGKQFQTEEPSYFKLIYDKYRNIYYRICIHRQKMANPDGTINDIFDKVWSIIVFDEELNKLNEFTMPAKTYDFRHVNAVSEGILIQNNSEYDPENDEDNIKFTLFEINKK